MKRKKKAVSRSKSKSSDSKKVIVPDLDSPVQVISQTHSLQQSYTPLDVLQEKLLQSHSPSQTTPLNCVSTQGVSQDGKFPRGKSPRRQEPMLVPCKEDTFGHCTQLLLTQSIPPWQQGPSTVRCEALHETATNETVQPSDSDHLYTRVPESDSSSQALRVLSPNIEEGESQQKASHSIFESFQPIGSLGDMQVYQKQAIFDCSSIQSEGYESQNGGGVAGQNGWQPEEIPGLLKKTTSLDENTVTTSQSEVENGVLKGLDPPRPDNGSLLEDQTFHLDCEIYQVEKQEIREEGGLSQRAGKEPLSQEQDMSFSAPISIVQPDNSQLKGQVIELHGDTPLLTVSQMPEVNSVLKENTLSADQEPQLKKFKLQEQDSTLKVEASPCEGSGQLPEGTTHSEIKTIEIEVQNFEFEINNLVLEPQDSLLKQCKSFSGGQDFYCPLESQAVNSFISQATSSQSVDQEVAAAGVEVPDSQLLGVLDENLNRPDQIDNEVSSATTSEPNRTHNQQPPALVSHLKCQPSGSADGKEDASSIVQGLIVELSNLNRLIMSTHRELRQKRGRFPPARGRKK